MAYFSYIEDEKIGLIEIVEEEKGISEINFLKKETKNNFLNGKIESENTKKCKKQIIEYLSGKRKKFNIELDIKGTEFQKKIFNILLEIPYGKVISYSEEAKILGNENAKRAVGNANGKNKIPIIIPCHRVIAKDKTLGGYSGGIEIKKYLLKIEGHNI